MNKLSIQLTCFIMTIFMVIGCLISLLLNFPKIEGLIVLIGGIFFDLGIAILAFKLRSHAEGIKRKALTLFGISFCCDLFLNVYYNMVKNKFIIVPIQHFNYHIEGAWFYILLLHVIALKMISSSDQISRLNKPNKIQLPFLLSALLIIIIFTFCLSWKINLSIPYALFLFLVTILEAFCFAFISSYMIALRNQSILSIFTGFLIIIASDYSMEVNQIENFNSHGIFQIMWTIGLAFIFYGFISLKPGELKINSEKWFYNSNSIQSKVALWNFILCLLLTFVFTTLISIIIWPHHAVYDTIKYLPPILISLTTITILMTTQLSKRLHLPLKGIQERIKNFNCDYPYIPQSKNHGNDILEYIEINKFLNKSFTLAEEKLNAEKQLSDLALNVAHDIRSPVSTIEMIISSLADRIPQEHKNILLQSTQNVRQIANDLLLRYRAPMEAQDKQESQNKKDVKEKLLLSSIIESVISQKRHEWALNPCDITVIINSNSKSMRVNAVLSDLERVLSNLLNNAYEALQDNRVICITLIFLENSLCLIIEDKGQGVSSELINDILNGKSLKHKGKGFGLSGAKKYMEDIGGKLIFSSIKENGSKVTLLFPLAIDKN